MEENFETENTGLEMGSADICPESDSGKKPKKKMRTWLKALCITLSVILILMAAAVGAIWWKVDALLNKIDYVTEESKMSLEEEGDILATGGETMGADESLPNLTDLIIPGETIPEPTIDGTEPIEPGVTGSTAPTSVVPSETIGSKEPDALQGDIINILLIGQDRRPGEGRCRSDSMILVTFNKTTKTITMTSFMRDAFVQFPSTDEHKYSPYKINHAYQYGGMSFLNETLKLNFGVEVDGDIAVDFSQFEKLIDLLGGVDITLTEKESQHLYNGYGITVPAGKNRLTGEQALAYSRIRYIDDDYHRAGRQRKVLQSLIDRYKSLSALEMVGMLDEILPLVSTNMKKGEIIDLVWELAPMLASSKFESAQIPAAGTFTGGYVEVRKGYKDWFQYNIDFKRNREILREIFDAD